LKLYYSHNLNPRVAVAVARHLNSPVEFLRADPMNPARQDSYRPLNPNTRVPILVEDHRPPLWETDAIACRLSALAGSDFWRMDSDHAEMIRWISWGTHHLTRAADPVYFSRVVMPQWTDERLPEAQIIAALADFRGFVAILDAVLARRDWLVGDHLSYADFRVATALPFAGAAELPLDEVPQVRRWHARLSELDAWREPFAGLA
jgi:glutathione S-transferase